MDFVPLLVAAVIVIQLIDVLKGLRNKDWNLAFTILIAWGAGIAVASLLAASDFADSIQLGDTGYTLGNINAASLILFGVAFAAMAGQIVDFKKAIDVNDSQKKPPLLGP